MMPLSLDAVWPYSPSCCLLFVWTSFLPDISFSQLPFLMVPRSLHPVCVGHLLWIMTALAVDSSGARDLTHFSLLTNFFPYTLGFPISSFPHYLHFPSLFTSLVFQFSILLSLHFPILCTFSRHPYLWASLFLETFFSSLLSTSHSLDAIFAWHHFSSFLLLHCFILLFWDLFPLNCFTWHLLSWHLHCLEAMFHSLTSLSFDIFVPCKQKLIR